MKKKSIYNILRKSVIITAEVMAKIEANSTCPFISYQATLPKEVAKLQK